MITLRCLLPWCGIVLASTLHAAPFAGTDLVAFSGACDASAVVGLNQSLFVVADDEDNFLRVYSTRNGGKPVANVDLSRFLGFRNSRGETDLEAGTRLGERIYWISSHGRNSQAKEQPRRQRFFATTGLVREGRVEVTPIGVPYAGLLRDLIDDPGLARFQLAGAARGAPKAIGALNIEGLAATPDGHLLIGFRNPVPQRLALLVPFLNPAEVIDGGRARFGDPIQLDLGGLGVRELTRWRDRYLILAGPSGGEEGTRLYEWSGGSDAPRWLREVDFTGLNPEAMTPLGPEPGTSLLVLSDDGAVLCDCVEAKKLKDTERKRFRAVTLALPIGDVTSGRAAR